jgi:DNA-binding SARP family transcriptional activator/tetratricopeptide (TPR) repeat protein
MARSQISGPPGKTLTVRLRFIGQMEATALDGRSVLPPGRKTRALLAIVALAAPRPALRSRLAELLWSRRPEEQARASLRQEIHRLLDVLTSHGTDIVAVSRDHLLLRPGMAWVDADEVMRASPDDPAPLDLLDRQLLEDLDGLDPAFDIWLHTERERLRDRGRAIAETLLRDAAEAGAEATIVAAQRLIGIDRAHEGAWRALMRAHAERGERGQAIQSYERCRAILSDMEAVPSPETQRLLAEIRTGQVVAPTADGQAAERPSETRAPGGRGGARIGVLPLQSVTGEDEEVRLALSLTADITSALTRFRALFLVSGESMAQVSEAGDNEALRSQLGIDFTLGGSVQRAGDRLRIGAQLCDLRGGGQVVWGRLFDREGSDLFALQDEVAAAIAAQVEPQILLGESRHALAVPIEESSVYEMVMRALPATARLEREEFMQAGDVLRRAAEQDPNFAAAHAWLSVWQALLVGQGWAVDRTAALRLAAGHAERAITLDPQDARSFAYAGHVRASLQRRPLEAVALYERAIALNPYLASTYSLSATAHIFLGELAEADRLAARYKQLTPLDPYAFFYDEPFSMSALLREDYATAAASGRAVSEMNPRYACACYAYLAALGHLHEDREANIVRRRLLAINPGFTVQLFLTVSPLQRPRDRDVFAAGLRLAGVPEGELASA